MMGAWQGSSRSRLICLRTRFGRRPAVPFNNGAARREPLSAPPTRIVRGTRDQAAPDRCGDQGQYGGPGKDVRLAERSGRRSACHDDRLAPGWMAASLETQE